MPWSDCRIPVLGLEDLEGLDSEELWGHEPCWFEGWVVAVFWLEQSYGGWLQERA